MKKEELKTLLKPLIKECIEEELKNILLTNGTLSTIVQEVLKGTLPVITEQKQFQPQVTVNARPKNQDLNEIRNSALEEARRERQNTINELKNKRASMKIGAVDIFENVTPTPPDTGEKSVADPLAGMDPNDPGVDISFIPGMKKRYTI